MKLKISSMTVYFNPRDRLNSFGPDDWKRVQRSVDHALGNGGEIALAYGSTYVGLPSEKLLAAWSAMEEDSICSLLLNVYHHCEEHPVLVCPLRDGMPMVPFLCRECDEEVNSEDDLSYDITAVFDQPVMIPTSAGPVLV